MKDHLKKSYDAQAEYQIRLYKENEAELTKLKKRMSNFLDMLADESITKSMYDEKMQECLQRQHELVSQLEGQTKADENYYVTVSYLLELVSRAYDLFMSSDVEQKRRLMSFLFTNLKMEGSKLSYSLKTPFHLLPNLANRQEWWVIENSNLRPLRCQRSTLTN